MHRKALPPSRVSSSKLTAMKIFAAHKEELKDIINVD